jgi:hypothetical protein
LKRRKLVKYTVHVYAVCRVKVVGVEAESQTDAIKKVDETVDLESAIARYNLLHPELAERGHVTQQLPANIEYVEFSEEVENYLVDEENSDFDYSKSVTYDRNGKPLKTHACEKCGQFWPAAKEESSGRQQGEKAPGA